MKTVLDLFMGYQPGAQPSVDEPAGYTSFDFQEIAPWLKANTVMNPVTAAQTARRTAAYNAGLFGPPLTGAQAESIAGLQAGSASDLLDVFGQELDMEGAFFAMYGKPAALYLFMPKVLVWDDNAPISQRQEFEGWTRRRKRIYRMKEADDAMRSPTAALARVRLELDAEGGPEIRDGAHIPLFHFPVNP